MKLRLLVLFLVLLVVSLLPPITQALSAPPAASLSYYVKSNWIDVITYNGSPVIRAFQYGYEASSGTFDGTIILHFARQKLDPVYGWGVVPYGDKTYQSNAWVKTVFQRFVDGYVANPAHANYYPAIRLGTSNANYAWSCSNASTVVTPTPTTPTSPEWKLAGVAWGTLAKEIQQNNLNTPVYISSATDFEAWNFDDPWVACGDGAVQWLDGYEQGATLPQLGTNTRVIENLNYGSVGSNEQPRYWTQEQVVDVSYMRSYTFVFPQIYCHGQVDAWLALHQRYVLLYNGVTSSDGVGKCQGTNTTMYIWQDAWNTFNDALTTAGYVDYLQRPATIFRQQP